MLFAHTYKFVLSGLKDTTRRFVYPQDTSVTEADRIVAISSVYKGRPYTRWHIGDVLDVETSKKVSIAQIEIQSIELDEDVRKISDEDLMREGNMTRWQFLNIWIGMYDRDLFQIAKEEGDPAYTLVDDRPSNLYRAWVLRFSLVKQPTLF